MIWVLTKLERRTFRLKRLMRFSAFWRTVKAMESAVVAPSYRPRSVIWYLPSSGSHRWPVVTISGMAVQTSK